MVLPILSLCAVMAGYRVQFAFFRFRNPKDGGNIFFYNAVTFLPHYRVSLTHTPWRSFQSRRKSHLTHANLT